MSWVPLRCLFTPKQRFASCTDGESRSALAICCCGVCELCCAAVHFPKSAVRERKGRWHVHFAAHYLDIRPGFAGACSLHRVIAIPDLGQTLRIPLFSSTPLA